MKSKFGILAITITVLLTIVSVRSQSRTVLFVPGFNGYNYNNRMMVSLVSQTTARKRGYPQSRTVLSVFGFYGYSYNNRMNQLSEIPIIGGGLSWSPWQDIVALNFKALASEFYLVQNIGISHGGVMMRGPTVSFGIAAGFPGHSTKLFAHSGVEGHYTVMWANDMPENRNKAITGLAITGHLQINFAGFRGRHSTGIFYDWTFTQWKNSGKFTWANSMRAGLRWDIHKMCGC